MKVSICFIQFNRINYLVESLKIITNQTYNDIEIVISDDASTDETEKVITQLKENYKYPIIYFRNEINMGYDRNYRQALELATGDYCIAMGNDDTIIGENSIENLVKYLIGFDYPDIGFTNYFEFATPDQIVERAASTRVLGTGLELALKYYNCFSFVGGLIYKRATFIKYNSNKHDGSIYAQMHLGMHMIIDGSILFSIAEPMIGKDIIFENQLPYSYKDNLIKRWSDFKIIYGGLPSVIHVIVSALEMSNEASSTNVYVVFKKIYSRTFPFWVLDYKSNDALPGAIGLVMGMFPTTNKDFWRLNIFHKTLIIVMYLFSSFFAILIPYKLFSKFKNMLYKMGR